MKKTALLAVISLLVISMAFASVEFEKQMPISIESEQTVEISVAIKSSQNLNSFDFVEFVPVGWTLESWEVHNYNQNRISFKQQTMEYLAKERTAFNWKFEDGIGTQKIALIYRITPVHGPGNYELISVWVYPGGFDSETDYISIVPKTGVGFCGDGICQPWESHVTCPEDCPRVEIEVRDATTPVIVAIIFVGIITGFFLYYRYRQKVSKVKTSIEELRLFIKMGLKKGYKMTEMIQALKGANIETYYIKELMKDEELKSMDKKIKSSKKVYPEDKVIQEIKRIVDELKEEDVLKELGMDKE